MISFRSRVLLFAYGIGLVVIFAFLLWDVYRIRATVYRVVLEEIREYAKTEALHFADHLYYGHYDRIEEHLTSNPVPQIRDMLVLSREGYILASKERGFVLFEIYPEFEDVLYVEDTLVKPARDGSGFIVIEPVRLGDRDEDYEDEEDILGYLIVEVDHGYYNALIGSEMELALLIGMGVFVVILLVVKYADSRFMDHLRHALAMLERVGSGKMELPPFPRTGDEFESLYSGIKNMSEKLRETLVSRDYYRSIIDSLAEGLIVLGRDGCIREANASALGMLGGEEAIGRHISEVAPSLYPVLRRVIYGNEVVDSVKVRMEVSEEERYFLIYARHHGDFIVVTLDDITRMVEYERQLEEISQKDYLTGIYNRRSVESFLSGEIKRADRYGRPLSVILFDIDDFKKVNDTFGHDVGDEVLKEVVKTTLRCLRSTDVMGRWGGEEFLVVLPETDLEGAIALAERIRKAIGDRKFEKVGSVTVSLGVADYKKGESVFDLVKKVDRALYRAKERGKNRTEVG